VSIDEVVVDEVAVDEAILEEADLDGATLEDLVLHDELVLEPLVKPTFRERLGRARGLLAGYVRSIRSRGIDEETWEELEEALIRADVGVEEVQGILDELRGAAESESIDDPEVLLARLRELLKARLAGVDRGLRLDDGRTNVWLFVGVNGVGKTTTIGKVGRQQIDAGHSVLMAAGDTFRAAAAEQLETWAERSGADFVRGAEGADPSAVVFDGVQRAAARGHDLVLGDTAGRLHTKTNLMDELAKVRRVADRDPGHVTEVLLVLDAVTGQNGLQQAKVFTEAVDLTGVVLTKLDGSAKGGIVVAIESRFGIPVKLVGLGEGIGDLVTFDPDEFVDALFE
jgi:fused signal recognition particle receptor